MDFIYTKFVYLPKDCPSTHGGSDYAPGSYFDDDDIICGWCGTRIKNIVPTGKDSEGNQKIMKEILRMDILELKKRREV